MARVGSKAPAPLLIVGTAAAVGNAADAAAVTAAFPGARTLRVTNSLDSYADVFAGNACVDELVVDHLLTGALPAAGMSCSALPEPTEADIERARTELVAAVLADQLFPALDSLSDALPELPAMMSRDRRY